MHEYGIAREIMPRVAKRVAPKVARPALADALS
jgi:hypothetical protein